MKQAITYNENTGVMGGARPTDLSKEDILDIALLDYRKNLPTPDNNEVIKPFDWSLISKDIFNQGFPDQSNVTSTPVVCKDGTKKMQPSSPNARYMDVCINNGGRAENQSVTNAQAQANSQANNTKEPIYYILVTAGVLVAGYFAYKKFKK